MKTNIIVVFLVLFFSGMAFPQSGWYSQSQNFPYLYHGVCFLNYDTGFIVGDNGTLLKTTNGGTNWITKTTNTTNALHKIIFINTEVGIIAGENGTIMRSVNAGENWSFIPSGLPANILGNCNRVAFANQTTGFIASCSGILKSTNAGLNWSLIFPSDTFLYGLNFINPNTGMAIGDNSLVIKTTDGGLNWVNSPLGSNYQLDGITSTSENIFYLVGGVSGVSSFMLRSTDFGNSWISMNSNSTDRLNTILFANTITGYAVGCRGNVVKTTNSGLNWFKQQINTVKDLWDISVISTQTAVITGKEGAIYRTTDGGLTGMLSNNTSTPDKYALYQNFPNPFNPTTTIMFDLAQASDVVLKIYNINGMEVSKLVDNHFNPGTYNIEWNAAAFNSGIYFYRLETQEGVLTGKMALIK